MHQSMRTRAGGFTLIELLIVVVIFAILAATAIPRFLDLQDDAKRSASAAVAGALGSSSMANYVLRSGQVNVATIAVANCTDLAALLAPGSMTGFEIAPQAIGPNAQATCSVDHVASGGATARQFIGHGVP